MTDASASRRPSVFDISKEDAFLSNRFPMPFWENAEIAFANRGQLAYSVFASIDSNLLVTKEGETLYHGSARETTGNDFREKSDSVLSS